MRELLIDSKRKQPGCDKHHTRADRISSVLAPHYSGGPMPIFGIILLLRYACKRSWLYRSEFSDPPPAGLYNVCQCDTKVMVRI